jgi:hypothetical protein
VMFLLFSIFLLAIFPASLRLPGASVSLGSESTTYSTEGSPSPSWLHSSLVLDDTAAHPLTVAGPGRILMAFEEPDPPAADPIVGSDPQHFDITQNSTLADSGPQRCVCVC